MKDIPGVKIVELTNVLKLTVVYGVLKLSQQEPKTNPKLNVPVEKSHKDMNTDNPLVELSIPNIVPKNQNVANVNLLLIKDPTIGPMVLVCVLKKEKNHLAKKVNSGMEVNAIIVQKDVKCVTTI